MSSNVSAAFRASLNPASGLMGGFVAGVLAPLLVVLLVLLGAPFVAALPLGLVAFGFLFTWFVPRVPSEWVALMRGRSKLAFGLWAVSCVLVVLITARLGVFMVDPLQKKFSLAPPVEFMVKHTCLSGYVSAAALAEQGKENLYDLSHYKSAEMDKVLPHVEPLERDFYAYPPQFLLLPKLMLTLSRDFFSMRTGWYVFYSAAALLAMLAIARWVGGREGAVLGVLTPVIWVSLPTLVNLQLGNIHLLAYTLCLGAMISFERRRHALGGAMLAFAVLAKIFPGVLGLYLLVQRRWKAVGWTVAFGAVYSVLALLVFGTKPFVDYVTYDIPRIASGELFDFVWNFTPAILVNYSPFGVPFKLQLVGIDVGNPFAMARGIESVFTLLLVGVAVLAAWRMHKREAAGESGNRFRLTQLVVWLALLSLASYRSPFAPWTYGAVGGVWLFAAFVPFLRPGAKHLVPFVVAWVLISIYGPPIVKPMVAFTLVAQVILYVTGFWIAARVSAPETSVAPAGGLQGSPELRP